MPSRSQLGLGFMGALLVSCICTTGLLAAIFWSGDHTADRFARWAALWVFTVGVPTIQAVILHRRLREISISCTVPEPAHRDLAHMRFVVLMCGSMTTLLVVGLVRAP